MAVTYTNITDGQGVATFATNQNAFGNAVKANIDTIETNVGNLGTSKISVNSTGMIYTTTSAAPDTALTTAYQKVIMTDVLVLNKANGHLTVNLVTGVATFVTAGVYNIHFAGAMTANNGILVTFNYNLNGVSVLSNPPQFSGAGSTPVSISNSMFIEVSAGSTIYIEAKAGSAATMTPIGCGLSVEKTHY